MEPRTDTERNLYTSAFAISCVTRGIGMTRSKAVLDEIRRCARTDAEAVVEAYRRNQEEMGG